jgi:hypothetical protein
MSVTPAETSHAKISRDNCHRIGITDALMGLFLH